LAPGGTQVALKLIPLDEPQSYKEIRALALVKRIRHPNIMPIVGIWLKDATGNVLDEVSSKLANTPPADSNRGTMLVGAGETTPRATELIAAMGLGDKSLHDRLEECQKQGQTGIPLDELLRYMEDSARAIDYLNADQHQLGEGRAAVHHGDIKPKNIMIVGNAAQVGDLGLARVLGDVRSTRLAISAAYASPESLKGLPPSRSTDQYSLAITYVELRTGELPFEHPDHVSSVMQAHLNGTLDLSRLTLPEQVVVRRATSADPDARFETAMDMIIALRDAVSGSERLSGFSKSSDRRLRTSSTTTQIRTPSRFWARVLQTAAAACLVAGIAWVGFAVQLRGTAVANANVTPLKVDVPSTVSPTKAGPTPASVDAATDENPFVEEPVSPSMDDQATVEPINIQPTEAETQKIEAAVEPTKFVQAIDALVAGMASGVRRAATEVSDRPLSAGVTFHAMDNKISSAALFGQSVEKYERFASGGNFELALQSFAAAIELQPRQPWLFTRRAELLAKMHRNEDALAELKEATDIDSSYSPAYRQRSLIYLSDADYTKASSAASQALLHSPRDVEALEARALAQANLGNLRTALADYNAAAKIDDQRGKLFRLRAVTLLKLRDLETAIADLDRALQLDQQDAISRRMRAMARLARGEYQLAIEDRQQVAEQAPGFTPALSLRVEREGAAIEIAGKQTALPKGTPLTLESVVGDRLLVKLQQGKKSVEGSIATADVRPFVEF
jgi:tetratricopeptide (TPR) repeat protein